MKIWIFIFCIQCRYFLFLGNINDNHGEASKELGKIGGRFKNENGLSENTPKGKLKL